jgi:hypothetical protein
MGLTSTSTFVWLFLTIQLSWTLSNFFNVILLTNSLTDNKLSLDAVAQLAFLITSSCLTVCLGIYCIRKIITE